MKCPHCGKETEEKQKRTTDLQWQAFQQMYPKRAGGQRWAQARKYFDRLLKTGTRVDLLVTAAADYRFYCIQEHKAGTQYVMQAATFLGQRSWEEDWSVETPFDAARRQLQEQP